MNTLLVGKVVATATPWSWSQAYHAGGLTAVISLSLPEDSEITLSLPTIGKQILNNLEAEFFGLAEKDLSGIIHAAKTSVKDLEREVTLSFVVASSINNVLYLVAIGGGKVYLKRQEEVGVVIQSSEDKSSASSSGFLEPGDVVILQTAQFAHLVPHETLIQSFDHDDPAEIAEILAPMVHKSQEGAASAVIFSYKEEKQVIFNEAPIEPIAPLEEKAEEKPLPPRPSEHVAVKKHLKLPKIPLSHKQRLYLSVAILLVFILIGSIALSQSKKQNDQNASLFAASFQPAKQKYDEGQSLLSLNTNLARNDFAQAQNLLTNAQNKFPKGSSESKQINDLLSKVNSSLSSLANVNEAVLQQVPSSTSPLLSFALSSNSPYVTQDDTNFYSATSREISATDKKTNKSSTIITNNNDWQSVGGLGVYFGNIYVLDTKSGILKYVGSGGNYTKSSYFSGSTPDVSNVTSLSIDGSIWLLGKDGSIRKFTKGSQDSFSLSGLDKPLSSPTQIFTTVDDTNVYVLDNGNSRIVSFKKDGTFATQYYAPLLKNAKQMDVQEASKKIYVLINSTVYSLDLK